MVLTQQRSVLTCHADALLAVPALAAALALQAIAPRSVIAGAGLDVQSSHTASGIRLKWTTSTVAMAGYPTITAVARCAPTGPASCQVTVDVEVEPATALSADSSEFRQWLPAARGVARAILDRLTPVVASAVPVNPRA
jgi:hypothetical protein